MKVQVRGQTVEVPAGATVRSCLAAAGAPDGVLAAICGSSVLEMDDPVPAGSTLTPLTLADEEGRRVYERSLRFVMLLAVRRLWPDARVRIEYSVSGGVLVRLPERTMTPEEVRALEEEMRRVVSADLRFAKKTWKLQEAIDYFAKDRQPDKVALLKTRPFDWFNMYSCGGMWEYFYGAMASGTGAVRVFSLLPMNGGFVMLFPQAQNPDKPAEYIHRPKLMNVFDQSAKWCSILGVRDVADLRRLRDQRELRQFIRVNETLHSIALGETAREIVESGKRLVLVAGPSSSGKTTFAGRLAVQLQVLGRKAYRLSVDDYYLDRDRMPKGPDGSVDLESLFILDLERFQHDLDSLERGRKTLIPRFSFARGRREPEGVPMRLGENDMVIVEGIHALNPLLTGGIRTDAALRCFVSALTVLNLDDHNRIRTTDVRLLRRMVRDNLFRGTTPEVTLALWESVRRGEEKWIFPFQERADIMFNTTLHYELPVLRHYAYHLLDAVAPEQPGYLLARRLMKLLHYIPDIDESILNEIPPLSLLREFIGGCTIDER